MDFIFSALRFIGVLLLVIMVFNLMIVVHEWGHYLAAKWRGLKIEAFQIWFGKPLWKKTINGVQYGLGSIPAGGFVKLPQMAPMGAIEGASSSDEPLPSISALDKIIVAFAGPLFSFGLACAFAVVVYITGYPDQSVHSTLIGYIKKDSPAAKTDLQPGDRIVKIDGTPVKTWTGILDSVMERIAFSTGDTINFEVERPGVKEPLQIASHYEIEEGTWNKRKGIRRVGVYQGGQVVIYKTYPQGPAALAGLKKGDTITTFDGQPVYFPDAISDSVAADPTKAVRLGVKHEDGKTEDITLTAVKPIKPADFKPSLGIEFALDNFPGDVATEPLHTSPPVLIKNALTVVYRTVTGLFAKGSSISVQQLSGPVRIGSMYYHLFLLRDGWQVVLWFSVIFNVNLAVLNLLPFPVLDGGHIVMGLLEMIRRRPVMNLKVLEFIQTACVLLLFGFMIYVTWFDSFDTFGSSPKEPQKPAPEFAAPAK